MVEPPTVTTFGGIGVMTTDEVGAGEEEGACDEELLPPLLVELGDVEKVFERPVRCTSQAEEPPPEMNQY